MDNAHAIACSPAYKGPVGGLSFVMLVWEFTKVLAGYVSYAVGFVRSCVWGVRGVNKFKCWVGFVISCTCVDSLAVPVSVT